MTGSRPRGVAGSPPWGRFRGRGVATPPRFGVDPGVDPGVVRNTNFYFQNKIKIASFSFLASLLVFMGSMQKVSKWIVKVFKIRIFTLNDEVNF